MDGKALRVQVVSDFVCPFCYIGKRRLERALEHRPDRDVQVDWLPFQLSPDMPREGRDRREHYDALFGPERARAIEAGMAERGAADGIGFQLLPGARSPNTLSAHALMLRASRDPRVDEGALAEKLFEAHHVKCEDIGDHDVLARLAGEVGMDAAEVRRRLDAGDDEQEARELAARAAAAGIGGVPFFIFDERHAVSGAQAVEAFVQVLDGLAAARAAG